ncbi:hypothetical protein B7990_14530 [Fibrobacter sp. UWB4]|uniref:DUF262 domain-containing protein n=1 Tax=Fibrobacter sp. UWB4 TaxID=1964356 RepID=UPI000B52608A|nr:DUF262 domain-containing protein [Fibrobacter sp. UWB4]OWV14991.1 hypothetical protein B7990_14530 [Fibrobacter sp. UWB4]
MKNTKSIGGRSMTVWKVGCRWSKNGNENSKIISVFRRNGLIFVGEQKDEFKKIRKGDLIAIADGYKVVSVAKATCNAVFLKDLNPIIRIRGNEWNIIDKDWALENAIGVTAKIFDLQEPNESLNETSDNQQILYKKRGSCCRAIQIADKVENLYEMCATSSEKFDIDCKRCSLKDLLDSKTHYVIPVYQREYSWGEPQITKFVRDLLLGFCGVSGFDEDENGKKKLLPKVNPAPMFIGTMQLSCRKYITKKEHEQDVIDGQQRFSTLLCLLKYLSFLCDASDIRFTDILESRVNKGKEDEFLSEAMSFDSLEILNNDCSSNKYLENIKLIKETFEELDFPFECYADLLKYIKDNIWFVVITTKAGISKTLEIFNTINTAGLDLNGGDLFKVRLYEYLKDKRGENQFDGIDSLYNQIKESNLEWRINHNFDLVNVDMVRDVYKTYLITKFDLPKSMYEWGTDRFYDTLFDVCLDVAPHQELNTNKAHGVVLCLEDLQKVKDAIIRWNKRNVDSQEKMIADLLVCKSRYGRYWQYPILYLLFMNENNVENVYETWQLLARIFFAYSIYYAKIVNEGKNFMYGIYKMLCNKDAANLVKNLEERKIGLQWMVNNVLTGSITDNQKKKDLICIVSAFLKEPSISDELGIEQLRNRLSWGFDVEHIHATGDGAVEVDWILQNSIGNLMLLEYDINRSIKDKPFEEKVKRYRKSKYAVAQQMAEMKCWEKQQIQGRKESEKKAILNFYNQT